MSKVDKTVVPAQAYVRRQFFVGKKEAKEAASEEEAIIQVQTFATEPAKVTLSMGLTMNMGNFESARFDLGVTVPCYREEMGEAYKFAQDWVDKRLHEEIQKIKKAKPDLSASYLGD